MNPVKQAINLNHQLDVSKRKNQSHLKVYTQVVINLATVTGGANLLGSTGHLSSDSGSNFNSKNTLMNQYIKALNVPFNSVSPRFNYTKQSIEGRQLPGPGAYQLPQKVQANQMKSPAFRAASRDKDSLFGKLIRKSEALGPGAYENNTSTLIKKTYNANLA